MGTYDVSHSQNISHDPRDLFTALLSGHRSRVPEVDVGVNLGL